MFGGQRDRRVRLDLRDYLDFIESPWTRGRLAQSDEDNEKCMRGQWSEGSWLFGFVTRRSYSHKQRSRSDTEVKAPRVVRASTLSKMSSI